MLMRYGEYWGYWGHTKGGHGILYWDCIMSLLNFLYRIHIPVGLPEIVIVAHVMPQTLSMTASV